MAHNEPLHQDLRCLQIQLFSSLVLKDLTVHAYVCINQKLIGKTFKRNRSDRSQELGI